MALVLDFKLMLPLKVPRRPSPPRSNPMPFTVGTASTSQMHVRMALTPRAGLLGRGCGSSFPHMYIHTYSERERERESEGKNKTETERGMYTYTHIYIYMCT